MRIDRARVRAVWHYERCRPVACSVRYGALEIDYRHDDTTWTAGHRLISSSWTEELYDAVERRILEAVAGISAHQQIDMIRDGLLIPELPHPGET
jgi:hypothetical protein